jgi:hypothetical protein
MTLRSFPWSCAFEAHVQWEAPGEAVPLRLRQLGRPFKICAPQGRPLETPQAMVEPFRWIAEACPYGCLDLVAGNLRSPAPP